MASFSNADNDYNMKHPTLLHNRLYFTELEVCNAHKRVLHGDENNTLNFTGNDYWLDNGRKTVRAILYKCVKNLKVGHYLVLNHQIIRIFA